MIYNQFGTVINDDSTLITVPLAGKFPNVANTTISPTLINGGMSYNYKPNQSGWWISPKGDVEFGQGYFRGEITGATGKIGGFTILSDRLYGGKIETAENVGQIGPSGQDGVVMDTLGLHGYSTTLGQVFNIPTDGSQPTFSNGVILVSNFQTSQFSGGTIIGTSITGGNIQTAATGQMIQLDSTGLRSMTGAVGSPYGNSTYKYNNSNRLYGTGVLLWINPATGSVPLQFLNQQTVADARMYNRSVTPSGAAVIGDICVVNGLFYICTAAGTPGTWTKVGTQT